MTIVSPEPVTRKRIELTPHEQRRQQLLKQLTEDFGDSYRPEELGRCVDRILEPYASMPAHHYVAHVAAREVREALRSGRQAR